MATFACSDTDQVTLLVCGIPIDSGWSAGTCITFKRNSDLFKTKVGPLGDVTRIKTNDNTAICEISLLQSSSANARLSTLAALDQSQPNGAGVGPFLLRDRAGTTVIAAEHCWISKKPDVEFGDDVTDRVWQITIADAVDFIGGN